MEVENVAQKLFCCEIIVRGLTLNKKNGVTFYVYYIYKECLLCR